MTTGNGREQDQYNNTADSGGWGALPSRGLGDDDEGWGEVLFEQGRSHGGWGELVQDEQFGEAGDNLTAQSLLNQFYEAEYTDEDRKYAAFQSVVEGVLSLRQLLSSEEVRRAFITCLFKLAERSVHQDDSEELKEHALDRILNELGGMSSDEARDGLTSYLELCSSKASRSLVFAAAELPEDYDFSTLTTSASQWMHRAFNKITEALGTDAKFASVQFALLLRQAKEAIAQKNSEAARALISRMYRLTALDAGALTAAKAAKDSISGFGEDDAVEHAEILEIASEHDPSFHRKLEQRMHVYALEVDLARITQDTSQLRKIFAATRSMNHAVTDSRTQAILKECAGQVLADSGLWSEAYQEFYHAFNHARESGEMSIARRALLYAMIANVSSGQSINPLEAPEARAISRQNPMLATIADLRTAFEADQLVEFDKCRDRLVSLLRSSGDNWAVRHIEALRKQFRKNRLKRICRAYSTLRVEVLAKRLCCSESELRDILVSLIVNEEIDGTFDAVGGVLYMNQSNAKMKPLATSTTGPGLDSQPARPNPVHLADSQTRDSSLLGSRYREIQNLLKRCSELVDEM